MNGRVLSVLAVVSSCGGDDGEPYCGAHERTKVGADGTAWLVTVWGDDLPAALVDALATPEPML